MRFPGRVARLIAGAVTVVLPWSCGELTSVREPVGISISAAVLDLVPGEEKVLGAWLVDHDGRAVPGSPDWSSSDHGVATIDRRQGVVTAIAVGSATMTAAYGAWRATAVVRVRSKAPAVALSVSPSSITILSGLEDGLVALATDSVGRPVAAEIAWSSSNPGVATVEHGRVTGKADGVTMVTATLGSLTATATVTIIHLGGSVTFARWTPLGLGLFVTDVLSFSPIDAETRSVQRVPQFESIASPAWSPDGSRLAVEVIHEFTYFPGELYTDYSSDVYLADPAAPSSTPWRAITFNGYSTSPTWSPDGKRIAYIGRRNQYSRNDIFIVDVTSGVATQVTKNEGNYLTPRWSPDGTRLAFSRWVGSNGYRELFVVNTDGTGLTNVSLHPASDFDPSWSPDGTQIAFVSSRESESNTPRYDIHVMNADGSNPRRLTTLSEPSSSPAWSPDGTQIVFAAGPALFVINTDGTAMARLTTPPGTSTDTSPAWRR